MNLIQKEIEPGALLLDPNNFRFQDTEGFVYADSKRFAEDSVQQRAGERLRKQESLLDLKKSIVRNGFLPVERIVVRPYPNGTDPENATQFVVIEGNRRVAAVKWILDDVAAGVEVSKQTLATIEKLPCLVAEDAPLFHAALMGIRHVSGIKQWGGYQRAKLVTELKDACQLDPAEIAERLGMTAHEVNRRLRAFKAFQQMQQDEDFGGYATPETYPIFHEAVSLPAVRDWLGWHEETGTFQNQESLEQFYELITPRIGDDDETFPAKITTYSQVRDLRYILPKVDAKKVLLDPHRTLQEAITVANREALSRAWLSEVSEAITALQNIGIAEMKSIDLQQRKVLEELQAVVRERLQDIDRLKPLDQKSSGE